MTIPELRFDDRTGVRVDLAKLLVSRAMVQGTSGAGKSHLLRYLLEQTYGQVQQIVIDREGEFTTLRERFEYLLVGPGGDIPADLHGAKLLPKKLLELRVSALIDLSELNLEQQRRFVADFVGTMAHLPRAYWTDCLVIIDEAHLFAPENGKSESATAIADLASLGRKRGFCQVLATSRLAKLSKDATAECLNKLIGRTSSDDLKRALEELGSGTTDRTTLRSLEPGQFYAYGPAIAVDPVLVRSGETKTAPPPRGAARPPAPPAPKAIRAILDQLADLPQQVDAEAKTMAGLQARVRDLERELAAVPIPAAPKAEVRIVERVVVKPAEVDRLQTLIAQADALVEKASTAAGAVRDAARIALDSRREGEVRYTPSNRAPHPAKPVVARVAQEVRDLPDSGPLSGPEQRVLDALAWLASIGQPEPDVIAVAMMAGYKMGGAFNNTRGALRTKGYVTYPSGGTVALTDTGRALAITPSVDRSLNGIHSRVLAQLTAPEQKLLRPLLDAYPEPLSVTGLAERTGYQVGGAFNNLRGRLRTLGLADYPAPGFVRAADLLFPEGLT